MRVHQLGVDASTDILAIGFSATDIVGHTYGPESQEMMDQLLRLDLILESLFQEIEASVGLDKTLVVLTADHGVLLWWKLYKARASRPDEPIPRFWRQQWSRRWRINIRV